MSWLRSPTYDHGWQVLNKTSSDDLKLLSICIMYGHLMLAIYVLWWNSVTFGDDVGHNKTLWCSSNSVMLPIAVTGCCWWHVWTATCLYLYIYVFRWSECCSGLMSNSSRSALAFAWSLVFHLSFLSVPSKLPQTFFFTCMRSMLWWMAMTF